MVEKLVERMDDQDKKQGIRHKQLVSMMLSNRPKEAAEVIFYVDRIKYHFTSL